MLEYKNKLVITTKYIKNTLCILRVGKYADGSLAIVLDAITGERLMVPTVCLVDWGFNYSEAKKKYGDILVIKEWSENEGITKALVSCGIIKDDPVLILENPYHKTAPPALVCSIGEDFSAFIHYHERHKEMANG